jgi:hypothetical protein
MVAQRNKQYKIGLVLLVRESRKQKFMHGYYGYYVKNQGVKNTTGQLKEQYFDYFVFNIVDYITPLRALAVPCNARGLAVARSRNLSATLGGSTSTRP